MIYELFRKYRTGLTWAALGVLWAILITIVSCAFSCTSAKASMSQAASAADAAASLVAQESAQAIVSLEVVQRSNSTVEQQAEAASQAAEAITAPETKAAVKAPLAEVAKAVAAGEKARAAVGANLVTIHNKAADVREAAASIQERLPEVRDVESLGARLLRLGFILALVLAGLVAVVVGWQYGLSALCRPILTAIGNVFSAVSLWVSRKWAGSAKLGAEVAKGTASIEEFLAEMRAKHPGFDRWFKEVKDAD